MRRFALLGMQHKSLTAQPAAGVTRQLFQARRPPGEGTSRPPGRTSKWSQSLLNSQRDGARGSSHKRTASRGVCTHLREQRQDSKICGFPSPCSGIRYQVSWYLPLSLSLKTALAIRGLLRFRINVRMLRSISVKNVFGGLIGRVSRAHGPCHRQCSLGGPASGHAPWSSIGTVWLKWSRWPTCASWGCRKGLWDLVQGSAHSRCSIDVCPTMALSNTEQP